MELDLDLAWATKAKQDPVELFKLHPGRFPLWHVKDLDKSTGMPTKVGKGIVDFKRAFVNVGEAGMKYFLWNRTRRRCHCKMSPTAITI